MKVLNENFNKDGDCKLDIQISEQEEEVLFRIGTMLLYKERDYNTIIQAAIEYVLMLQMIDAAEQRKPNG